MSDLTIAASSGIAPVIKAFRSPARQAVPQTNPALGPVEASDLAPSTTASQGAESSGAGALSVGFIALSQASNVLQGMQSLARSAASAPSFTDLSEEQIMYNRMVGQANMLVAHAIANGISSDTVLYAANWTSTPSVLTSLSDLDQAAQSLQSSMAGLSQLKNVASIR